MYTHIHYNNDLVFHDNKIIKCPNNMYDKIYTNMHYQICLYGFRKSCLFIQILTHNLLVSGSHLVVHMARTFSERGRNTFSVRYVKPDLSAYIQF